MNAVLHSWCCRSSRQYISSLCSASWEAESSHVNSWNEGGHDCGFTEQHPYIATGCCWLIPARTLWPGKMHLKRVKVVVRIVFIFSIWTQLLPKQMKPRVLLLGAIAASYSKVALHALRCGPVTPWIFRSCQKLEIADISPDLHEGRSAEVIKPLR